MIFLIIFTIFTNIVHAQLNFELKNPKNIQLAKPFTIQIQTNLHKNIQIIAPDSNFNFYPYEWISSKIVQKEEKIIFEYTLRSFVFEDSTSLKLPFQIISKQDTLTKNIILPAYFIPKTLSKAEIEKGIYADDRFLSFPKQTNWTLYVVFLILFLACFFIAYKLFKRPVIQWLAIKKLEKKQKLWLQKVEKSLHHSQWIVDFVKQNKEYIEPYTNEKWTSLTVLELEQKEFPELFIDIRAEFLELCKLEYQSEFSGKPIDPNAKTLANNVLKKMKSIFELEKKQHDL